MLGTPAKTGIDDVRTIALQTRSRTFKGRVDDSNRNDYFKIRLKNRSTLDINLTGLQDDADAALLNRKKRVISKSANSGIANEFLSHELEAGTYYIQVSRRQGATSYQLNMSQGAAIREAKVRKVSIAQQVLQLVNFQRRSAGLLPFKQSPKLTAVAKAHSWDMANNDYFSHTGSNNTSPFDRIKASGYKYSVAAENIAAGQLTPTEVVQAWMNSPVHRANILNPKIREIGIGYAFLQNDTGNLNFQHYWTQDFGTPMG